MTVDEAEFFSENHEEKIVTKLKPLQDVGLGYFNSGKVLLPFLVEKHNV
jgi:excinuclease ABC subunit A